MNQTLDPKEIAFRHFWDRYPRKIAIAEARVAFFQALNIARADDIIIGAGRFAIDPNRTETFTPYPAKWLSGQRWMDGPLPPRTFSPEELAQREIQRAKDKDEAERLRSIQVGLEMEEARKRAVPMTEEAKEIRKKLGHYITK